MKNLKIKSVESFEDNSELVEINNACTSHDEKYLSGFQVDILVSVTNSNDEIKEFNISHQSTDRNELLMNYANAGMSLSAQYGNDGDDSGELESWLEETDDENFYEEIIDKCLYNSFELSQAKYDEMIAIG